MIHSEALLFGFFSYEDIEGFGEVVSVRTLVSDVSPSEAGKRHCNGRKYTLLALGGWRTVRHLELGCSLYCAVVLARSVVGVWVRVLRS